MDYLAFWGKAQPVGPIEWHPLAYHGMDVAATVTVYLQKRPTLLKRLSRLLGLSRPETLRLVQFLAAVHDLGKFSYQFQSKAPAVFTKLFPALKPRAELHSHAALGLGALVDWLLENIYPGLVDTSPLYCVANAACGHHGKPAELADSFGPALGAAREYLEAMRIQFEPAWPVLDERASEVKEASWLLAGILSQCDWVGSSQHYFPYTNSDYSPAEYFLLAVHRAERAVSELRLTSPAPEQNLGFARLFPSFSAPTPLQRYCDDVTLGPPRPKLYILEDETGSGKTEAALTLAGRLLSNGFGEGVLMALPSQTTADALYKRLLPLATKFFVSSSTPSVVLAHGGAKLSLSRLAQSKPELGSISAELRSWAQDSNKTALLADFGVATIDQVAMSVLATKHTAMRQLGLTNKVLIVDEVHACEPYLLGLLERVLARHASQGGSAILLSATLPASAKVKLVSAFKRGAGGTLTKPLTAHYPLATCVSRAEFEQTALSAARASHKLLLRPVDETSACTLVENWLQDGKCVCFFKNTVKSAQETYRYFDDKFPGQVTLVHARYATKHRGENDESLLERFGSKSDASTRRGQLVISTQVGEQSLDLDFDEAVSDLAPLDALLQRFGRRRRHARDLDGNRSNTEQRFDSPAYVIMPQVDSGRFLAELPFGTALIYDMPGVLHRTARVVAERGEIVIPQGVRDAIDYAYSEDEEVPEVLRKHEDNAEGRRIAETGQARLNALSFEAGYDVSAGQFSDRAASVTRLGGESIRLVLCDDEGKPLFGDAQQSAVSLRAGLLFLTPGANEDFQINLSVEATNRWSAEAMDVQGRRVTVRYSRSEGFSIERKS